MKKSFIIGALTLLLTGCGVGTYAVQSGLEDASYISFTDTTKEDITVTVDNTTYNVKTVKQKAYKSGRKIRQAAENCIKLPTGQHNITVTLNGNQVYSKKVFLSAGEHKIIEL